MYYTSQPPRIILKAPALFASSYLHPKAQANTFHLASDELAFSTCISLTYSTAYRLDSIWLFFPFHIPATSLHLQTLVHWPATQLGNIWLVLLLGGKIRTTNIH